MMGKAVLAKGFSKLKFKIGLIQRVLKLSPIAFGLFYGINEFAVAVVVASTIVFFVYAIILHKKLGLNFGIQCRNLLVPNLVFFSIVFVDVISKSMINNWSLLGLFFISHLLYLMVLKHESYYFIIRIFKQLYSRLKKDK